MFRKSSQDLSDIEVGMERMISHRGRIHKGRIIWVNETKTRILVEYGPLTMPTRVYVQTKHSRKV